MNRMITALAVTLFLAPSAAHAQAQPGDVGIFFTATPATGADAVENGVVAMVPFRDIFVLSFDVPGGMEAYAFSIEPPAGLIVTGGRFLPAGGLDLAAGEDNWVVGTGGICQGAVGTFVLVRYGAPMFLADPGSDAQICLRASQPNVGGEKPGYLLCDAQGDVRAFGTAYRGCAVINPNEIPVPIPTQPRSFGALKAAF
jgi:hypothetical protein